MSRISQLLQNYRRHVSLPLKPSAPAAQRIWFAVYPPDEERRLLHCIQEFELATKEAQLGWHLIDLRGQFADWLKSVDPGERTEWFRNPQDIELYGRTEWRDRLAEYVKSQVAALPDPTRTVVALSGLTELYDYVQVSELLEAIGAVPGFLLLFFPGERENNIYRFLCAREGWDYLAVPILSDR